MVWLWKGEYIESGAPCCCPRPSTTPTSCPGCCYCYCCPWAPCYCCHCHGVNFGTDGNLKHCRHCCCCCSCWQVPSPGNQKRGPSPQASTKTLPGASDESQAPGAPSSCGKSLLLPPQPQPLQLLFESPEAARQAGLAVAPSPLSTLMPDLKPCGGGGAPLLLHLCAHSPEYW